VTVSGRRTLLAWAGWLIVTVVSTMAMLRAQASFGQVHVVLVYLLIVLCASASGGRVPCFIHRRRVDEGFLVGTRPEARYVEHGGDDVAGFIARERDAGSFEA